MSKKIIKLEKIFKKKIYIYKYESESDERDKSFAANNNNYIYNRDQIIRQTDYKIEIL